MSLVPKRQTRYVALLLLILTLFSPFVLLAKNEDYAVLSIPEALNVLYVDGKKFSPGLFSAGDRKLSLENGEHRVILEFEVIHDIDSDDHERVVSEPFMIGFQLDRGTAYTIRLPRLNSLSNLKRYARLPQVDLVEEVSGKQIPIKLVHKLEQNDFLANMTRSPGNRSENQQVTASQPQRPDGVNPKALDMLWYWWGQASPSQRQNFLEQAVKEPK